MSQSTTPSSPTPFADALATALGSTLPPACQPGEAKLRVQCLGDFCPVYRDFLLQYPHLWPWLNAAALHSHPSQFGFYQQLWQEFGVDETMEDDVWISALQRFRRQVCMLIAYNELNSRNTIKESLVDLSHLAEFVLRQVSHRVLVAYENRLGVPWDNEQNHAARFAIIGLGKLGGSELNFCSDIDLLFLFQGKGSVLRKGKASPLTNEEFYARVCRDIVSLLQGRGSDGFLYNVDLRLRPEGSTGPIIRSLSSLENYYSSLGQTWERLALVKGRLVAGDAALGNEFFESLASFRYPRRPPPGLLTEIAGVKLRTEREVQDSLALDIKSGPGGIREIEFFAQALQMIHAGRNPFLQTPSTLEALECLYRYEFITAEDYNFLEESYLFLRKVEHRLQMREEEQTHLLPSGIPERILLAESMGYSSCAKFDHKLTGIRNKVRELYLLIFGLSNRETEIQEWTLFFSGMDPGPIIYPKLRRWFWGPLPPVEKRLRLFLIGSSSHNLLTREHIALFMEIARQFDTTLGLLAHPMNTLERIDQFAERYGARKTFLNLCAHQPHFFRALCLMFDRSRFIHELLCARPEIVEEIFMVGLRLIKSPTVIREELALLPQSTDKEFSEWLWLYVRAEQVRLTIANVLGHDSPVDTAYHLTQLADVILIHILARVDPDNALQLVALGKYGSRELTPGSDLDLMVLSSELVTSENTTRKATHFLKLAGYNGPTGKIFDLDLRLRPYGSVGPIITTMSSLKRYHAEGSARLWERQLLTRARVVNRSTFHKPTPQREPLVQTFVQWKDELLFSKALNHTELDEILTMRKRIEVKASHSDPVEKAFKSGPGGLMDIEFATQMLQLMHGWQYPALRSPETRVALQSAHHAKLISTENYQILSANYRFLRTLELFIRRDNSKGITHLSDESDDQISIAKWMGFKDSASFLGEHSSRMASTRQCFNQLFNDEKSHR